MKKTLMLLTFGLVATLFAGTSDAQLLPRNRVSAFLPVPKVAPLPMQATPIAAASDSKKLGPVACVAVRMHLRHAYLAKGKSFAQAVKLANQADDETINGLVADAEKVAQAKVAGAKFGAIGDGSIIAVIIEFFKSPQGQALIAALVEMLIHLIGGL